ncbi:hypothetical protein K435DRAFT_556983, partial [Dendrothele bispora CBS 962.96]
ETYGSADTLIARSNPFLHISNFSKSPVIITQGQSIGLCHDPDVWLDKARDLNPETQRDSFAYARLLQNLMESNELRQSGSALTRSFTEVTSKAQRNATSDDEPTASEPLEGGPKTSEVSIEAVKSTHLLTEVSISPDLTLDQRKRLEDVISRNSVAFGLDGRLGHHDGKVDISLKAGSQPVSLPPFPASPANRQVI